MKCRLANWSFRNIVIDTCLPDLAPIPQNSYFKTLELFLASELFYRQSDLPIIAIEYINSKD